MSESHIAGLRVEIGEQYIRQRCAWCGTLMVEHDRSRIAFQDGDSTDLPTWEIGAVIRTDGNVTSIVEHVDGESLPDDACIKLDPAVTR